MRIATFNVNGIKARLPYLSAWLKVVAPDVVGIQELKSTDEQFPHDALRELGYQVATHGQKSWNGVAILSREPARVTHRGLTGQEEMGARLISAEVSGVHFTTVYIPNGKDLEHEDFPKKLAWLDTLGRFVETELAPSAPHVVCGDFNVVPTAFDSYDENHLGTGIFHTEPERTRLNRLLDWGLVDLYRALNPKEPGFSWWDYRAGAFHKKQGLRIDLVLGTEGVSARAKSATVDRAWRKKVDDHIPSDHAPVWVDLD